MLEKRPRLIQVKRSDKIKLYTVLESKCYKYVDNNKIYF